MNSNLDNVKVIDVTLRDGGYRNRFNFSLDFVQNHVKSMYESGVDYVEIGYRNGSVVPIKGMGITGFSENQYIQAIREVVPDMKLVVIAHAKNITEQDVHDMADMGVSMVRFCTTPENIDATLKLSAISKQRNMTTGINFVRISSIADSQLAELVKRVDKSCADVIYFADSNGNLNPSAVSRIAGVLKQNTDLEIGFHAHDNLGLAMSNSIAAVESGTTFIDASLLGMGKGIGNLKLEKWIAYNLSNGKKKYILEQLLKAVSALRSNPDYVASDEEEYTIDIKCGLFNVPFTERHKLENA
ncbi:3-hydroxy-3-methylglutaryl-CoA lyase [Pseudoalteromonas sp. T1lg23B]|uniref:3-hydroxy-3-methylglutaryl-CoA lyase n=1 Tax=Pseudoalteromonas sp. T1lg23B TaxID=2077097 RepID=UPI000CF74BA6|nr:3-hydroxy-3-methylglutaryl-CoA lyase [Pseudoalteromonas sp. T1lg23B]